MERRKSKPRVEIDVGDLACPMCGRLYHLVHVEQGRRRPRHKLSRIKEMEK